MTEQQKEEIQDFVRTLENRLINFVQDMEDEQYPPEAYTYLDELLADTDLTYSAK